MGDGPLALLRGDAWRIPRVAVALILLSNLIVLWGASVPLIFVAGFVLMCLLPGFLLIETVVPRQATQDGLMRAVLSVGAGYVSLIVGGLLIHYLPGPLTSHLILLAYDALLLLLLVPLIRRNQFAGGVFSVTRQDLVRVGGVLAVAGFFCLTYLGYSEFQGDEAVIMRKATAAIQGRTDAIFVHKKGPAEILIPTLFYTLQGQISEAMARLPFALAALAALATVYQLGRTMFNPFVGLMAGLLLAINGFVVAFGRIVQYQSVVFLMSALALLCFHRAYQEQTRSRRYLILGIVFVGTGLLAHYDAAFVGPALAYLAWQRWRTRPDTLGGDLKAMVGVGAACAVLLAGFYIPLVRHPYFRTTTVEYITDVRMGGGLLYNTLSNSFVLGTFYNSTYYVAFLALTLMVEVVRHLTSVARRWVGVGLALLFVAGTAVVVARPQWWQFGDVNLTFFFLAAFVLILLSLSHLSTSWKATWLWFGVPFVFYASLVGEPRTHFHIIFPAWALLSALGLDRVRHSLKDVRWRQAAALGFMSLYLVFGYYTYLVFVRHDVEYKRTFPDSKHPLYWTTYDELPRSGWFGFPYRAGWKVIGALYDQGVLRGDYDSNEEPDITNWYTRGAWRCAENPRYYFVAENVQDERIIPHDVIAAEYEEVGRVTVDSRPRIRIYQRAPATAAVADYPLEAYSAYFDQRLSRPAYDPDLPFGDPLAFVQHPLDVNLAGQAKLVGYAIDAPEVKPGGVIELTLYWQALAEMDQDYQAFVHVEEQGVIWGQRDHTPGTCAHEQPTSTWQPGQIIVDRSVVPIDPATPEGQYPLLVGLYDWQTLERLQILGPSGQPQGNSIPIREIAVRSGS